MENLPKTYDETMALIEKLKQHAEALRKSEAEEHLADVAAKIAKYGYSPEQLGLSAKPPESRKTRKPSAASKPAKKAPASTDAPVKYIKDGKTWLGRGRMPKEMSDAKKAGEDLEQYRVKDSDAADQQST